MIQTFNFTNIEDEMERFPEKQDMVNFLADHGCDGVELQMFRDPHGSYLADGLVKGVHLSFWNNWLDFWLGNKKGLEEEFGSLETAYRYYGGQDREVLVEKLRREVETAEQLGASYVVFHVSEITILQSYHRQFAYRDEEVIDASCELIGQILGKASHRIEFLMENLWWPGLNYQRPEMTQRLLDGVHYEKKGLMLDTGHLMNANTALRTQKEAVAYLHRILDAHEECLAWIRGIHLNASLSGAYVEQALKARPVLADTYEERWCQVFSHVFQMDQHRPFTDPGVRTLIERIQPAYVTHELISRSKEELGQMLDEQKRQF